MRFFKFLIYCFAFFLGASVALFQQCQFPPRPPKNFQVQQELPARNQKIDNGALAHQSDPQVEKGKLLFKNNCAACHNRNMIDDLIGPALANTEANWSTYPRPDLYRWIRSSQEMIAEGHPRALELWKAWKPGIMNNFPNLEDEEIEAILIYIAAV